MKAEICNHQAWPLFFFLSINIAEQKSRSEQLFSEKKQQQNWNALAINEAIKSNLC